MGILKAFRTKMKGVFDMGIERVNEYSKKNFVIFGPCVTVFQKRHHVQQDDIFVMK